MAEATTAGLPATFAVIGEPAIEPSPVVQVNLFRIAQEALTNARRHAGPGATADVRVRFDESTVELEVTNTGRRGVGAPGLGQRGMRERAAVSGGSIEMGPRTPRGVSRARAGAPRRRGGVACLSCASSSSTTTP